VTRGRDSVTQLSWHSVADINGALHQLADMGVVPYLAPVAVRS
jgi:hypothetical protein